MNKTNKQHKRAVYLQLVGKMTLLVFACVVAVAMVHHYFYGENGYYALMQLKTEVANEQREYDIALAHNRQLMADVNDLKTGLSATEEYARKELGLIKEGEIFVQLSTVPVVYGSLQNNSNELDTVEQIDPTIADSDILSVD